MIGEYIYKTLIILGPTYQGEGLIISYPLEILFFNISAHRVLAKQYPQWQEREQPPQEHLWSLLEGKGLGITPAAPKLLLLKSQT